MEERMISQQPEHAAKLAVLNYFNFPGAVGKEVDRPDLGSEKDRDC